jgi:hypothetical protein
MNCPLRRLTAGLLVLSIATTTQAEIIGHSMPTDRERIGAYLDREEVGAELVRHGLTPESAKARVAALTDAETAALAGKIDALPAGGFIQLLLLAPMAIFYIAAAAVTAVAAIGVGVVHLAKAVAKGPTGPAAVPAEAVAPAEPVALARAAGPAPTPVTTAAHVAQVAESPFPASCRFNCSR